MTGPLMGKIPVWGRENALAWPASMHYLTFGPRTALQVSNPTKPSAPPLPPMLQLNSFKLKAMLRKIGSIMLIAAPILGFLFLFYFYYVPKNRDSLNKQGFLILKQQQESMEQMFDDLGTFFLERVRNKSNSDLSRDSTEGRIEFRFNGTERQVTKFNKDFTRDSLKLLSVVLDYDGAEDNEIYFNYRLKLNEKTKDSIEYDTVSYIISFKLLADEILESRKKIYFSSYFISAEDNIDSGSSHIAYHSRNLPVAERVSDSATFLSGIQFSMIKDLSINDVKYKAYLYPFQHRTINFVLCGLIKNSEHLSRQQSVPFTVAYAVLMILLVALVALPYLKIFILTPGESLKRRDLVFQALSFFVGTAFLLLIVHVLFMQVGTRSRTTKELTILSKAIRTSFIKELGLAYRELKMFDDSVAHILKNDVRVDSPLYPNDMIIKSGLTGVRPICLHRGRFLYYHGVFWTDDAGDQVLKGRTDTISSGFINVSKRNYFKRVKSGRLLTVDDSVKSFYIEPVYSQTTNEFAVNLVMPSKTIETINMAAISTRLSSLINTIVPYGYDFYVIERSGKILFQSNGPVTLQENFLEWMDENKMLTQAMLNRQSRYLPNESIFDNSFDIRIDPIDQLPWFLITVQNNNAEAGSYIHIIVFVLFFLTVLFLLLFLCFTLGCMTLPVMKILKSPAERIRLLRPGTAKFSFLIHASFYLCVYLAFTVLCYYLFPFESDKWLIALIYPLFALTTLIHLYRVYYLKEVNKHLIFSTANLSFIFCLLLLTGTYLKLDVEKSATWIISLFIVGSCVISMFRYDFPMITRLFIKHQFKSSFSYYQYYAFLLLCVVCFSILPTHFFYEYAQKKEIALNMKTQQLDLARRIEGRMPILARYFKRQRGQKLTSERMAKVFLEDGVYSCADSKACKITALTVKNTTGSVEMDLKKVDFFDLFANHVIISNLSSDSMLTENNRSDDLKWFRNSRNSGDSLSTCLAYKLRSFGTELRSDHSAATLVISTYIPDILQYYNMNHLSAFIIISILSLILLCCLFLSIRAVVMRIFPRPVIIDRNGNNAREDVVLQIIEDSLNN